ncbi:MAG: GAP family protein [Ilumatobacter sp.]|jgi:threonine/homoserine/homoserine lactone efflux protein|uniref:GAP family protein n=1 Tax=uncultured Ilumatobacter sp. TaxID=879968 RepID=UPI00374F9085|nr:GAP family protein [Ilumatobacter sp.]MDG2438858.1 GAP family protein [Ilumatobacter sp.]
MGAAIGETLGFAVGIAISPIPIAAVILMLFSGRARINSVSFLVAWFVGIALVTTVVMFIPGLEADDGDPSSTTGWIKLAFSALLFVAGARKWRTRPGPDDEVETPAWMNKIHDLKPGAAFGLGFVMSTLNPKNLLLALSAGVSIGALSLTTGETVGAVAVFTMIAAITVIVPVFAFLFAGERLEPTLQKTKNWLLANNSAMVSVLLLVFGFSLLGDAIQILS